MQKPSNKPISSWQHSDCPWPNVRLWGGGVPHPDSAGSTLRISYPQLIKGVLNCEVRKTLALACVMQACPRVRGPIRHFL